MSAQADVGGLQVEAQSGTITVRIVSGVNVCEADITRQDMAVSFMQSLYLAIHKAWPAPGQKAAQ